MFALNPKELQVLRLQDDGLRENLNIPDLPLLSQISRPGVR